MYRSIPVQSVNFDNFSVHIVSCAWDGSLRCVRLGASVLYIPHGEKGVLSSMREMNQFFVDDEYQTRFGIWMANARFVQKHNARGIFRLSMNELAAFTPAECQVLIGFWVERLAVSSRFENPASSTGARRPRSRP